MIGDFFVDGLRQLGDFLGEAIDKGGDLIGGLMELKVGGAGWGLESVNLFYSASKVSKDTYLYRTKGILAERKLAVAHGLYLINCGAWPDSQAVPTRRDPLVLDLNKDGKVELKNAAFFDLNANGFHEFTRWIDGTDAFLVLDKNFNGKADDGSELFGDVMTLPDGSKALTGFDALRAYDSNGDGKIDASDEIYASLKVLTGEGKMSSLADAGVKSLSLASEAVNGNTPPALSQSDLAKLTWEERVLALKDQVREADRALWESGGSIRAKGTFEWQDGSTGTIAEALPYSVPMYSIPGETLDVPEDIAALPDLMGFGNMHDLRQAMVRDESGALRGLVEQYAAEKDPSKRGRIFESLIQKWAGVDGLAPGSRGGQMDARQLAFLEKFFGENFNGVDGPNPNNTAAPILKELYADLVRDMEAGLLVQTHLKPFFEHVEYKVTEPEKDAEGNIVKPGKVDILMDPAFAWLGETAKADPRTALEQLWGLNKMLSDTETDLKQAAETSRKEADLRASYRAKLGLSVDTPTQTDAEKAYAEFLGLRQKVESELKGQGAELKDFLEGDITWQGSTITLTRDGRWYRYGGDESESLYGQSKNDILSGGAGEDKLYGQSGDDILVGGTGDDVLEGSYGSDTYVYNKGDGHDVINNYAYSGVQDKDVLKFGEGISSEDLEVIRRGNDVTFSLKDGTGSVRVQDHFYSDSYKLDEVEFSDGTKWSTGDVESRAVSYEPGTNAAASAEPTRAPAAPEAFSAVLPSSAMSESEAGVLSETEAEESLAALSTPSFMSSLDHDDIEGLGGGTSLASVLPDSLAPVDSETARLGMDVALAGLSFEAPGSGQVCDALLSGSSGVEAVKLSVASEASLEKHFEDGARYDELPKSAA